MIGQKYISKSKRTEKYSLDPEPLLAYRVQYAVILVTNIMLCLNLIIAFVL